jgi:alkaline phosphatase
LFASRYRPAVIQVAAAALVLAAHLFTGIAIALAAELPKNIIILMADGAAVPQWDFGKYSSAILREQPFVSTDIVFKEGSVGLLTTHASNTPVTDSAAAATAMSTGFKVENGAISVTRDGKPLPTVMEVAKARGKRIGLVTTARVYDATPAAFSLHAKSRWNSQALVDQYLELEPDVLLGGGADYFLPAGTRGGKRKDGKDVIAAFRAKGYEFVSNTAELKAATRSRLLGLFASEDMRFELDRDPAAEPTTAEMAAAALKVLSRESPNGFVLLIENENVDTAGHHNDTASLMHALWAFDDAVRVALEFRRGSPETLVIVTGDHETGGLSITDSLKDLSDLTWKNRFNPTAEHLRMIARISISLAAFTEKLGAKPTGQVLDQLLAKHFPGFRLDPDLRELILRRRPLDRNFGAITQNVLARMISRQTGYFWATSGHTPQPAIVGAMGPGAELFRGFQDNTHFGKHLHRLIQGK